MCCHGDGSMIDISYCYIVCKLLRSCVAMEIAVWYILVNVILFVSY
jgi:hypothetical protein